MFTCSYCKAIRPLVASARSIRITSTAYPIRPHAPTVGNHRQVRHYAVPKMKRVGPSPLEVFNLAEIPMSSFTAVIERSGEAFNRASPAEYYDCVRKFHDAISRGSDPWSVALASKKDGFSVEVIHDAACIMRQVRGPRSADAFSSALWAAASDAGYRPSILSLARHLVRSGAYGRVPQLKKVEARFKQLVSTARDADALTVEGELQYEQGNYEASIRALRRALQVETPDFEWKHSCQLCMGKSLAKLNQHEEARALFESLSGIGFVEADVELGKLLRVSDKDTAERHLFTAASNGRGELFSLLSEIALEKAADSENDKASKEESLRWAKEWSKLADPRTEY